MPRYGRFDAIYFFETSGGVLRGSRCVRHVPELEKYEARNKNFDRKSRFSLGNVPPTDIFHFSKKKLTFEVEIFISLLSILFIWDVCKAPALSFFTSEV